MASPLRLLFPLLFVAGCAPAASTVTEADLATIQANRAAFAEAMRANDHDALVAHYTEEAIILPNNESMIRGRMAHRESLNNAPDIADFIMSGEEMTPLGGDAVLVTGHYNITMREQGAELALQGQGKYVEVWVRQAEGWQLGWHMWNSNLPMPSAPPVS